MTAVAVGIDIGTSGARAAAVDAQGASLRLAAVSYDGPQEMRDPRAWLRAVGAAVSRLAVACDLSAVRGVAVAGTSGSVVATDAALRPLGVPLMYADPVGDPEVLATIAAVAPTDSPARGANSALARAMVLSRHPETAHVLHQADLVLARLAGRVVPSDETTALKTGYDPVARRWAPWLAETGIDAGFLPVVRPCGMALAEGGDWAREIGLPAGVILHAGLTDGCAAFLATGACRPGEAVTSLGSTLVLKLVSDRPVFDGTTGVYSHRLGGLWLAGGASNTGGAVLAGLFGRAALSGLDAADRADLPTGFDLYPLLTPGERFPVCDPGLAPRLSPRPEDRRAFYQAVLEGMAGIEALGYRRLAEQGAPPLVSVRSVGGGARAAGYTAIRQRALQVPFLPALSDEAAVGAARLALWQGRMG